MKSMITVLTLAVLTFAPGIAVADDEDDVIAAVLDYISGWNNGDAAKIAQYMLPDATAFQQGNNLAAAPFTQAGLQNPPSLMKQVTCYAENQQGRASAWGGVRAGRERRAPKHSPSGPWAGPGADLAYQFPDIAQ